MNQESQNEYRNALVKKYEQGAFEALCMYGYYGQQYQAIEQQVEQLDKQKDECEAKLKEVTESPDHHTVENRNRAKLLRDDVTNYEKRIKGIEELIKKLFEESTGWQQKGARLLEQVEHIKAFRLKTPEEIAADKAKVATNPEVKA